MSYLVLGGLGFILLGLYDINSILWKNKFVHLFFLIGLLMIGVSTALAIWSFRDIILTNLNQRIGWLVLALVFMALLIHALFFALPFEKTYIRDTPKKVYMDGVYALCRHPGVLWFIGFYLSIYLLVQQPLMGSIAFAFSFLNFLYIVLQDLWTFPNTFFDYEIYKQKAPFLIPNLMSIKRTFKHNSGGTYDFKK